MSIRHALCLAVTIVLTQPLHAQSCSGGVDGGMDATGNQCSTPGSFVAHLTDPDEVASAKQSIAGHPGALRTAAVFSSRRPPPQVRSTALATPVRHFAAAPAVDTPPLKTAKFEVTLGATCSGGVDGGMDATGNQCSNPPVPAERALINNTLKR